MDGEQNMAMSNPFKTCITVGTADALPKALVVFRGLAANIASIAGLGYDGIELGLFDAGLPMAETLALLDRNHLCIPVVSTGQVCTRHGLSFIHHDSQIRRKALDICKDILEIAGVFGAAIGINRLRGSVPPDMPERVALEMLTECLAELCNHARVVGVQVLLEHFNHHETNYLLSVDALADYIRSTGIANLKLHIDSYHMHFEEPDIPAAVVACQDVLGFVHLSDSDRQALGLGSIPLDALIEALQAIHYSGWIGVEVLPEPSPLEAAACSLAFIRTAPARLLSSGR